MSDYTIAKHTSLINNFLLLLFNTTCRGGGEQTITEILSFVIKTCPQLKHSCLLNLHAPVCKAEVKHVLYKIQHNLEYSGTQKPEIKPSPNSLCFGNEDNPQLQVF